MRFFKGEGTAMSFHDVVTDVEPQSGSLADRFCGKKGFKNIQTDGIENARSGIFSLKDNPMMVSVNIDFQKNGSGKRHIRLNGVLNDIQSHLTRACKIPGNKGQVLGILLAEFNGVSTFCAERSSSVD